MTVLLTTVGSDVIIAHWVDSSRTGTIKSEGHRNDSQKRPKLPTANGHNRPNKSVL